MPEIVSTSMFVIWSPPAPVFGVPGVVVESVLAGVVADVVDVVVVFELVPVPVPVLELVWASASGAASTKAATIPHFATLFFITCNMN
jgi:hypothetical protein